MIIYIELIILVDLIINLLTLFIIKDITFFKFRWSVFLVFIIDIFYIILYLYKINLYLIKYLIPFIYVLLSFKANIKDLLKIYLYYLILNFLLGGLILSINIASNIIYFIVLVIYLLIFLIAKLFFKRKNLTLYHQIKFNFKNKTYKLNAFFDTGCNLFFKGYPVIVLNKKYHFNIYSDEYILIATGQGSTKEKVYLINELYIDKRKIKCYCVFLDIDYDALISYDIIHF